MTIQMFDNADRQPHSMILGISALMRKALFCNWWLRIWFQLFSSSVAWPIKWVPALVMGLKCWLAVLFDYILYFCTLFQSVCCPGCLDEVATTHEWTCTCIWDWAWQFHWFLVIFSFEGDFIHATNSLFSNKVHMEPKEISLFSKYIQVCQGWIKV